MDKIIQIRLFTIRNKSDNTLIYAEGIDHSGFCSEFEIDPKWLEGDETLLSDAWYVNHHGMMAYSEEIRHLVDYNFAKIVFSTEEMYQFTDNYTLEKV